jgi:hypothetical protein
LAGIDLPTILTLVVTAAFGGSGIAGWIFSYLQMKNERKKQGIEYFRQLVLTPDFMRYLSQSFGLTALYQGTCNPESFFYSIPEDKPERRTLEKAMVEWVKCMKETAYVQFFLPQRVGEALLDMNDTIQKLNGLLLTRSKEPNAIAAALDEAGDATRNFRLELTKKLGIEIPTERKALSPPGVKYCYGCNVPINYKRKGVFHRRWITINTDGSVHTCEQFFQKLQNLSA